MLGRRFFFPPTFVAVALSAHGCFLTGAPYESLGEGGNGADGGGGNKTETTTSAAGGHNSTETGNVGGANTGGNGTGGNHGGNGANGGGGNGAGGNGGGGNGGAGGGPIEGDICPGIANTIGAYGTLVLSVDTAQANNEYGFPACGGGQAPDLVYQIQALAKGTLDISIVSDAPYEGFVFVRTQCADPNSGLACSTSSINMEVEKDQTIYVFVDGKATNPAGKAIVTLKLDGCGNGVIEGPEECDDGNDLAADGCISCKVDCSPLGSTSTSNEMFLDSTTKHCYLQAYAPNRTWDEAQSDCLAWGGQLAGLSTTDEITLLTSLINKNFEDAWIGGNDKVTDGAFKWINGEVWIYENQQPPWDNPSGPDEPNGGLAENCVEIYSNTKFNDAACDAKNNYLCERVPAGAQ